MENQNEDPQTDPLKTGPGEDIAQKHEAPIGTFKYLLREIWKLITLLPRIVIELVRAILNIADTTDPEGTIAKIKDGIVIKGYNIWILVCSSILACIGLDTNSEAIIIGAMLISPLMSPILGIGLSVGINDRETLRASVKNFMIAVGVSLLTAFIYFTITPLGEITPQLEARTQPTLLDIGVAFFGGVAGIVAGSRKDITNAIPGVAIATALMPPVCTAGFGLARFNMPFFAGSIYLFFLNAVFISLSTYLIVRFLHFPYKAHLDRKSKQKVTRYVLLVVLLISIPSIWLLVNLVKEQRFNNRVEDFIAEVFPEDREDRRLIDYTYIAAEEKDSVNILNVNYYGKIYPDTLVDSLEQALEAQKIRNTEIHMQKLDIDPNEFDKIKLGAHKEAVTAAEAVKAEMNMRLDSLQREMANLVTEKEKEVDFGGICSTLKEGFPEIEILAMSNEINNFDTIPDSIPTVFIRLKSGIRKKDRELLLSRMDGLLRHQMEVDTLLLYEF